MMILRANVTGIPQPKGSPKPVRVGKRTVLSIKTRKGEAWERQIMSAMLGSAWQNAGPPPGPVAVSLRFRMPRPRRYTREMPHVRPDIDKLARSALDALQRAGIFTDDAQVCVLLCQKRYCHDKEQPGLEISVRRLADGNPPSCTISAMCNELVMRWFRLENGLEE